MSRELTHLDSQGRARMVDIGSKPKLFREAVAEGKLFVSAGTLDKIQNRSLPKGRPVEVARIAGIQAAKQTSRLIPLCHQLSLDFVDVEIDIGADCFTIRSRATCRQATGVEMEALTAVAVAALTLYDMCKAVDKSMTIGEIRLVNKTKKD